ncbi:DUF6685 family protein (plasmid) [Xanthomonas campestris pv. passiflorae]|uniref:DUF6685 family protein n=1 Tax=Xanthomonas phaseoli TaxID=1985254 RepID=UPI00132F7032|nr:DUF6685 family protein [Xanthomonas phaseoli]
MWKPIRAALNALITDVTGEPLALRELLSKGLHSRGDLPEPERSAAEGRVVRWNDWASHSALDWPRLPAATLQGWTQRRDGYVSQTMRIPELAALGISVVVNEYTLDLCDIEGFSSSKSDLHEYPSVEDFAQQRCPDWISDVSHESLRKLLAHDEIRVLHSQHHTDHFSQYGWDGRVFLSNAGGSHHTAAAQYVANRLQADVPMSAPLRVYLLNVAAVDAIAARYEMFAVPEVALFQVPFHDALKATGAAYLWHRMPAPYQDQRAVFLPRENSRSLAAAAELRAAGAPDLGIHLTMLVERQQEMLEKGVLRVVAGPERLNRDDALAL